jgi:zinc/manganese transport system permease protein
MIYSIFIEPFAANEIMRYTLAACVTLSFGCAPLGIFLSHKRMILAGDALSHSILPGVAIAFVVYGMSLWNMVVGGFIAGSIVVILASLISRTTGLKDDNSIGGLYIISLALGVIIISMKGSDEEMLHVLFGNIDSVTESSLATGAIIVSISLLLLAIIYRPLIAGCIDPVFARAAGMRGQLYHNFFLILVVLNLVASFHLFGTLTAIGILILPGIIANFWNRNIDILIPIAIFVSVFCGLAGVLISYHNSLPAGPSVVVCLGVVYFISIILGSHNSIRTRYFVKQHLTK